MVFYRKYRPQKIDDLDSQEVREALTSVLSGEPAHAFLFTGPKGLGKTSSARIIAKVVNCETSKSKRKNGFEPCDKCESCTSIVDGTNMDILEIDAASNRGIDEIRDLKEKIRLAPLSAKMKVYIIDEVHMLTTEAFNALLKTLEEPPPHAMFILCTTEPQKVPATIVSRCLHVSFKKATDEELVRSFNRIATGEKISIDKEALKFIASLSDGSFRDGAKIMEEISLLAGKKQITKNLVEEKYKITSLNTSVTDLLKFLKNKDTAGALSLVAQIIEQGVDVKYFIDQLIGTLHALIFVRIKVNDQPSSEEFSLNEIRGLAELLSKAHQETKYAVVAQLPLELAIIDWGQQGAISEEISGTVVSGDMDGVSVSSLRKQVGNIKKIKAMYGSPVAPHKDASKDEEEVSTDISASLLHTTATGEVSKEWLDTFWKNIISEMKSYNHTIAGVLRGCRISGFDKKNLVIETNYKFHKERLDDLKAKTELSRVAKMLTGKDVTVVVELKK